MDQSEAEFCIHNYVEHQIAEYLIEDLGKSINVLIKNASMKDPITVEDREYFFETYKWAFEFLDTLEVLSVDQNVNAPIRILCKYEECKEHIMKFLLSGDKLEAHLAVFIETISLRLDIMEAVRAYKQKGF